MITELSETPAFKAEAAPVERVRLEFVDGLRALAALFVVVHHAWLTIPNRIDSKATAWLNLGHFAVDLFIVLSGFCLALPMTKSGSFGMLRGGALEFYKRRARRILPPYYFALAASLLLVWLLIGHKTGSHWDASLPVTSTAIIAHLLLLNDFIQPPRINHAMWSIAVEWQIYFLLPLMAFGWRRLGAPATTLLTAASGYALLFGLKRVVPGYVGTWIFGYIALFAFGTFASVLAASTDSRRRRLLRPLPWSLAFIACAAIFKVTMAKAPQIYLAYCHLFHLPVIVGAVTGGGYDDELYFLEDFEMGLVATTLLVLASCPGRNWLRDVLSWKPLVIIGTFAYSVYLLHAPLLQVIWQYGIVPLHVSWRAQFLLLAVIGTPLLVGLSYLFFLMCEKPWLVHRPNESMRQIAQDAAISPAP